MLEFEYVVKDKAGLHARPAGVIVKGASGFNSQIIFKNLENGKECDAKKLFALMNLAVKCGTPIELVCDGADEDVAMEKMKSIITENL